MITAQELRIGNFIFETQGEYQHESDSFNFNENDKNFRIVDLDILKLIHSNNEYYLFQPIPLTPEILEKCGFEKDEHDFELKINFEARLKWSAEDNPAKEVTLWLHNDYPAQSIFYLHQLQNLYFALTGEELEVKL